MVLPRISLVSFRRRLFDSVDGRKLHTAHIPRLGGIAFFPCITITVSLVIIGHNQWMGSNMLDVDLTNRLLSVFCGLFLLYLTGMMDDLIGVRYRSKFLIQILCGILLVASGLCFDNLYGLFGIEAMPYYIGAPFTVFIIVYILNAINLIDGIDGLASGLSIIAFFAFGCMFIRLQWWMYAFICLATIGVLLPFFYYNVYGNVHRGRKIFMGDTGSLTIGMLLAVMAIRLSMSDPLKESTFPGAVVRGIPLQSCRDCRREANAKKVFATENPDLVIVDYKDDATAFNGLKKGTIAGKGVINNRMSNMMFRLMETKGIPTHYVEELSDRETLVKKVQIVPLEVIIRNTAAV